MKMPFKKTNESNKSGINRLISNLLGNTFLLFGTFIFIALASFALKEMMKSPSGDLSVVENVFFSVFETLWVVLAVSIFVEFVQKRVRSDEMDNRFGRYEDTIAAAELLQRSRKNNGLSGIVENPDEEKLFEELSQHYYRDDTPPEIWWMNFRIEKYDTFAHAARRFVQRGGKVRIITTHPENPNIPFRLREAYRDKALDSYKEHFRLQAETFITLERSLSDTEGTGEFKIYFNKESTAVPIFLIMHDLDVRAFSGFYLNEISGAAPYVVWETAGEGMVKRFKDYMDFKVEISVKAEEMATELDMPPTPNPPENEANDLSSDRRKTGRRVTHDKTG